MRCSRGSKTIAIDSSTEDFDDLWIDILQALGELNQRVDLPKREGGVQVLYVL